MKFSANLGFLWTELSLPNAIRAARQAGFDAVECHWPFDTPVSDVKAALDETGLPMLGLNTRRGNLKTGENGLAALPGREEEARAAIDEALTYAQMLGTPNVHVMCGFAEGTAAHNTFVANLSYACEQAAEAGQSILIEPLNSYDAPGYFLNSTDQAAQIIDEVDQPNLKLMFDCYHVQLLEGDVCNRLTHLLPKIGHIQFASVPDRGAPDHGELNYTHVFGHIASLDWTMPLGAEYKPGAPTEDTLGWLSAT